MISHTENKTGQIGVITTWDNATLWQITSVNELDLTVQCCDNSEDPRNIKPENFWVLVDSI
jgi:hypothetical protein